VIRITSRIWFLYYTIRSSRGKNNKRKASKMLRSGHSFLLLASKTRVLPRLLSSRTLVSALRASSSVPTTRCRRSATPTATTTTLSRKVAKRRMSSSDGGFLNRALDEDSSGMTADQTAANSKNSKVTFRPSRRASQVKNKRTHPSYFCPACNAQCKATVFRRHTQKCCPDIESAVGKETWMTEDMDLIMGKAQKHADKMLEEMKRLAYTDGVRMSHAEVAQTLKVSELRVKNALRLHSKSIPLNDDTTPVEVIYEDDDILVVNKPPYLRTHPIHRHTGTSLINRCISHLGGKECYIVHRLDMDTSGVIMFVKNPLLTRGFAEQFMTREANKTYLALCVGVLPLGKDDVQPFEVNAPISSCEKCKEGRAVSFAVDDLEAKESRTTFDFFSWKKDDELAIDSLPTERARGVSILLDDAGNRNDEKNESDAWKPISVAALVLASPKTGRTHQIRVHLAHAGLPILGDMLYGPHARWAIPRCDAWSDDSTSKPRYKWSADKPTGKWAQEGLDLDRQALHAYRLEVTHPLTNERLSFEAPLPDDMKKALDVLGINY